MNLYKRGRVYYMDFIYLGKRVNKSTGKTTEKDAAMVVKREKERMLEDLSSPAPTAFATLSEAIERVYASRWIKTSNGKKARQTALLAMQIIGDLPLDEIDYNVVDKMGAELIQKGKEIATANRYKAAIRTIMRHMGKNCPGLFIPQIETPVEKFKRFRTYTRAEEQEMVEYMKKSDQPLIADLLIVLLDTGMRLSEALSKPLHRTESHIHLFKTKSKDARAIPMTSRVKEILKNVESFPWTVDFVEDRWAKMRKALGRKDEKDYVLHTCRHTTASRLIQAGEPIEIVQKFMGHSSITITLRYAHHDPDRLMGAVATLDALNAKDVILRERSTEGVGEYVVTPPQNRHLRVA